MIDHIVGRLETRLRTHGSTLRGSKAAILGLAFKEDVSDTRNSPSLQFVERLTQLGVEISAYDPFVHELSTSRATVVSSANIESAVENAEILLLITPHTLFKKIDLNELSSHAHRNATIVDTRGFWSPLECKSAGFDYLGLGRPD